MKRPYTTTLTTTLTPLNIQKIFKASYNSVVRGVRLNRLITINIEQMNYKGSPQDFLNIFLDHYRKFALKENFKPAYVWVLENNPYIHAHILLHFPPHNNINQFKRRFKASWFKDYTPSLKGKGSSIDFKTLKYGYYNNPKELLKKLQQLEKLIIKKGDRLDNIDSLINTDAGTQTYYDLINILNYLSKGVKSYSQGSIEGRRTGISRNLL